MYIIMATVRIPKQKVILCGEYGVGKSSLFRRFTNNTFVSATDRKSTLGLDQIEHEFEVGGKKIRLQLWDTGGMERVASVTSSYYKFAEGAILVFSLDNPASFHALSQHLLEIVNYAENAKIFICGNKSDIAAKTTKDEVSEAEMEAFREQCHSLISGTFRTSCKTGEGVKEMFTEIARILVEENRFKMDLQAMEQKSFQIDVAKEAREQEEDNSCVC